MIKKQIIINGVMTVVSGLAIGGTKDDIGIQAKDNPIIRNPLTKSPYIPGSSIKGKMRSLFESSGLAKGNRFPCGCGNDNCIVCKLFGAHKNTDAKSGVPRLIFRDATLTDAFENVEGVVELKTETAIDRTTGTASKSSLRQKERISAGVKLNYEIVVLVTDTDNADELQNFVEKGLRMIEATGLGSKITAGYGKVDFGIGNADYKVTKKDF